MHFCGPRQPLESNRSNISLSPSPLSSTISLDACASFTSASQSNQRRGSEPADCSAGRAELRTDEGEEGEREGEGEAHRK